MSKDLEEVSLPILIEPSHLYCQANGKKCKHFSRYRDCCEINGLRVRDIRRPKGVLSNGKPSFPRKLKSTMKVPFDIVNYQIDKMYAEGLGEGETLNEFLLKVESFIESCGWDVDEFDIRTMFGELN